MVGQLFVSFLYEEPSVPDHQEREKNPPVNLEVILLFSLVWSSGLFLSNRMELLELSKVCMCIGPSGPNYVTTATLNQPRVQVKKPTHWLSRPCAQ